MNAPRAITERHYVLSGVIWLNRAPIGSVDTVRVAADPEAVWITLHPGRDYGIVDAEGGQVYVSALVGTLVEIAYTAGLETQAPGTANARGCAPRPTVIGGGNGKDVCALRQVPRN